MELWVCVKMDLNTSFPATRFQNLIEVDDEHTVCAFCGKHMATAVSADALEKKERTYVTKDLL
ncbi:hypothetical protein U0070_025968 [Myodes glareolus]|uniref:Uncharacterized protein n=1 Tax=Myodes glareolus TaxID=447135 RepID=A0AAW0J297_MYOGA